MKRIYISICFVAAMTMASIVHASPVNVTDARQVADRFFASATSRVASPEGEALTRLSYTAPQERFFVFNRGERGGFIIVSGDDRLPQVLGYGAKGDFSLSSLPPAVQYWLESLDRQIAYLQSHSDVVSEPD